MEDMTRAKKVYDTLCTAMDNRGWVYQKDEEKMRISFGVKGEDMVMEFVIMVDAARQVIRLMSPLSFRMSENKRMDGAIATCVASYGMANGSFDYDITDGTIAFRMTASFRDSIIGDGMLQYMIDCSCAMVDRYNDKFLAINVGVLSIEDFIAADT